MYFWKESELNVVPTYRGMENFKDIIDRYYGILYRIGRSYTRNPEDFDDLYQEMLIQIHEALKNFREESKLSTYIYRVALNTALTFSKKSSKKRETYPDSEATFETPDDEVSEKRKSEQKIELLYTAINELKKDDRAIMFLHLEGKQYSEISEILGIAENNARVKFMRIKKRLHKILTEKGYEHI